MIERHPWQWIYEHNAEVPEYSMKFGTHSRAYVTVEKGIWCYGVYIINDFHGHESMSEWCEDIDDGLEKAEIVAFLMLLEKIIYGEVTRTWEQSLPKQP